MISNHFYKNKRNLKRNIAKVRALGSKPPSNPILHFEAYPAMQLIENFVEENQTILTAFGNLSNSLLYNFTKKKSEAIEFHKHALEINMNISTLVDMDHDIKNRASRVAKGSPERIPRIHTTSPASTLLTSIYVDKRDSEKDIFNESMRKFPSLALLSDTEILALKESAITKTWARFEKAIGPKMLESLRKDFQKKKLSSPINDHSLVETLMEKIYGHEIVELNFKKVKQLSDKQKKEMEGIEQKLRYFFLKQPEKVLILLSPLFEELNESYIVD